GGLTGSGGARPQGSGGANNAGGAAGAGLGGVMGTGGRSNLGGSTGSGGMTGTGGSTHSGPWRIMPLGDSITGFCYPQNLSGELTAGGFTSSRFEFVGTVTNNQGNCLAPAAATVASEGHGCYFVTRLENNIT